MSDVILTSLCETCKYGTVNEEDKARVKVYCSYKEKEFYFGQCVPCTNYTKIAEGEDYDRSE